ncbi:MAG: DUF3524 domain-containing protein [Candidatus Brocadiaceae bacterium]|nr:DUF3524 domain-containing protein [Candidatus Brocadiaceae bacterium]
MARVLALEPYYGGSHQAFLDGYRRRSRHAIDLLTMSARKWKWRMRGAALFLHDELRVHKRPFDILLVSDFLDLAALMGMAPRLPPETATVAYFHENQLTYPVPSEQDRDYQFGFTNITTCLAADRVLFNSRHHRDSFLGAARALLGRMPDYVPRRAVETIARRSQVVPVGVELADIDAQRPAAEARSGPLTVLWNHRWEYDKGAEEFFDVMCELQAEGYDFRLAVTGQQFRTAPAVFEAARRALAPRIRRFGYVEGRGEYCRLLLESDLVVSTAEQEFFGISVVEAVYAGCVPVLPNRLSYPELLPESRHAQCLYEGRDGLKARLVRWLEHPEQARALNLSADVARFGWEHVAPMLDDVIDQVSEARREDGHG